MTVNHCDKCGVILDKKLVSVGHRIFSPEVELCFDCGAPVLQFLKDNELLMKAGFKPDEVVLSS